MIRAQLGNQLGQPVSVTHLPVRLDDIDPRTVIMHERCTGKRTPCRNSAVIAMRKPEGLRQARPLVCRIDDCNR